MSRSPAIYTHPVRPQPRFSNPIRARKLNMWVYYRAKIIRCGVPYRRGFEARSTLVANQRNHLRVSSFLET